MTRLASRLALGVATALLMQAPIVRAQEPTKVLRPRTTAEDLQLFSQVLNQIRVNHADSVDSHRLFMAAITAMVRAADPHSYVIPVVRLDSAHQAALRQGKLIPLPVAFRYVAEAPLVASVHPGTEAAAQDILPGDELVAVDGRVITAESELELEVVLAGPKDSRVTLTVERRRADGSTIRLDRTVKRERARKETGVPVALMLDAATGYVRVTTFVGDRVADDLDAALERLERRGMTRLLLDLRDNGGGRVDQASKVAGAFLPRGTLVYSIAARRKEFSDTGRVGRSFWRSERTYPVIVLVNGGTASASELVAGALQDLDRALIVGAPTFGKALVMQGFPLSDGSIMTLVTGRVSTPCGRVVQRSYQGMRAREYYREAGLVDTAGRPSCRTTGGRTVYGGGGIYPDVRIATASDVPPWLERVGELGLVSRWAGAWTADIGGATSATALAARPLGAAAVADFRALAAQGAISIPADAGAEALLNRVLVAALARTRFGEAGYYEAMAMLDPIVRDSRGFFPQAAALPGVR